MRFYSLLITGFFLLFNSVWETDFQIAKKKAGEEHKFILLNFSGSDWCGPCIRMNDEFFESKPFTKFAEKNLILVNADFPRLKKNQLDKEQQKKNEKLAFQYNPEGVFPVTLLLSHDEKVIMTWRGLPYLTADQFTEQIKDLIKARK